MRRLTAKSLPRRQGGVVPSLLISSRLRARADGPSSTPETLPAGKLFGAFPHTPPHLAPHPFPLALREEQRPH